MCRKCYNYAYSRDLLTVMAYKRPTEEYFFEKVDTSAPCWEWTAGKDRDGYGVFSVYRRERKKYRAHRWCWEFLCGEKLGNLVLDHSCRNRPCVNPDHLEPMTKEEHDAKTLREVYGIVKNTPG